MVYWGKDKKVERETISKEKLKEIVHASTDFNDFKTKIAEL